MVDRTLRQGDVAINSFHELEDGLFLTRVTFESLESRTFDNRNVVTRVFIHGEKLAHLHLDELKKLIVVDLIGLVQENYKRGHTYLTGKQDVLTGLGHGAVCGGNHEDTSVHLSGTGDHVFDVIGVAGAVNVGIVTNFGLILNVSSGDRDTTLFLLGSGVDFVISFRFTATCLGKDSRDSGG